MGQSLYGYTHEYSGDSTQLMYLRSRYYSSDMGRFLSRDSWMGDYNRPLSLNRWNYVEGNPINYTDPSGQGPIHFQVIARYAVEYGLMPEYIIQSTIPNTPPLWPGQRRGKRVDLADLLNFQIWEVEEYSASGNYPKGHGPGQVDTYLDLLNINTDKWMPGRWLRPQNFSIGAYDVNAWWDQPGLIVYRAKLNQQRVVVTTTVLCAAGLARLIQQLQQTQQRVRDLPGQWPPLPESPLLPVIPVFPPPLIPVPIFIP